MRLLIFGSLALSATYFGDVLPILQLKCQGCHRQGEMAPMPLETYEQVRPLALAIRRVTEDRTMPPWFADPRYGRFSNDPSLTQDQIATKRGITRQAVAKLLSKARANLTRTGLPEPKRYQPFAGRMRQLPSDVIHSW